MKYSKYLIPTLSICLFLSFTSCIEDKEQTQVTVVKGKVYDTNKQQAVANATVYIQAYKIGDNPAKMNKSILDSVKTDVNGNYNISLQDERYKPLNLVVGLNNAKIKYPYGQKWHIFKGEENIIDFDIIELHPIKLRVIVKDNPRPPLTVQITEAHEKKVVIYGVNADTTVTLVVIPNQVNEVGFHVVHPTFNTGLMSRFDTINAQGVKPFYQSTHTVYPDKFNREYNPK